MVAQKIPTSKNIHIEINDSKIAVIEGYSVNSARKLVDIWEFSSSTPTASMQSGEKYEIELHQVYFLGQDRFDFHSVAGFTLTIVKPDCKIIFSDCQWVNIDEMVKINAPCMETIQIVSSKRRVKLS